MDLIPDGRHHLSRCLEPRSVLLIGPAREPGTDAAVLAANLAAGGFTGRVQLAGDPDVSSAPVDLALIACAPGEIEAALAACERAEVAAALVVTEVADPARADEIVVAARALGVRILGPGTFGLVRARLGLNASLCAARVAPGALALVAQSSAVCAAMVDWAAAAGVGFSTVVATGGGADVGLAEVIDYLAADFSTASILVQAETLRDGRRLASSLRAAARSKPVILMRSGGRGAGRLPGPEVRDEVLDAVVRRCGAIRVRSTGELVAAAAVLTAHGRARGERLAIVTNGAGPGMMAADRAAELGLPPPLLVDLARGAGPARYVEALRTCVASPEVDGVVVIHVPQGPADPEGVAAALAAAARASDKPVIPCWMGEASVAGARSLLSAAGIPSFELPERAVQAFAYLAQFHRNQESLLQVPAALAHTEAPDLERGREVVSRVLAAGREELDDAEAADLMEAFRIPVRSVGGALPACELAAGIVRDAVFGPAIVVSAGSRSADAARARVAALPPLNVPLAEELVRISRLVPGNERRAGRSPVDAKALASVLMRLSEMAVELPQLESVDLDPLEAGAGGVAARAIRVRVRERPGQAPHDHLSILPYPTELAGTVALADGTVLVVRPIRPEDAAIEAAFVEGLSAGSRRMRFQSTLRGLTPAMLARFTQVDYDREMALIAIVTAAGGEEEQVAVVRYARLADPLDCEFAIAVGDEWQGRGLGRRLMERLIAIARARGFARMEGQVLAANAPMLRLCAQLGFVIEHEPGDMLLRRVRLALR